MGPASVGPSPVTYHPDLHRTGVGGRDLLPGPLLWTEAGRHSSPVTSGARAKDSVLLAKVRRAEQTQDGDKEKIRAAGDKDSGGLGQQRPVRAHAAGRRQFSRRRSTY